MDKTTVTAQAVDQVLSSLGYEWHSSEYYISPDEPFFVDTKKIFPARPNFYGLIFCVEGWLEIKVNDKALRVEPNCFLSFGPNVVFQKYLQGPDCKLRGLIFTKEFLLKNIANVQQFKSFEFFTGSSFSCIRLTHDDTEPLLQLYNILKTKREKLDLPYQVEIIRNLFFAYLYEVVIIYQKRGKTFPLKITREVDLNYKFRQLLIEQGNQLHNLKFYADPLFITPKYLISAIKKSSGTTPGELINEMLIDTAKRLLKESDKPIGLLSEELLFSDQASFTKFFKRQTGLTPFQFRQAI